MAIALILFSAPYAVEHQDYVLWVAGNNSFYYGILCIGIAALCDWLDGAAARWVGVESAIGKDLDSLADVVSFGVAPSMILWKMLWTAAMSSKNAYGVNLVILAPALLVACFGALRLAKFNNAAKNNNQFTGVPIPAIGLFIAGVGLVYYHNQLGLGKVLQNIWVIYAIVAFCCWAMLSKLKLFTLKIKNLSWADNWGRYIWLGISIALLPLIKFAAIPLSFLLYIIISFIYKPNSTTLTHE
jgi:CDP-diacylglycerol---serine O-phosphatidyltransferase